MKKALVTFMALHCVVIDSLVVLKGFQKLLLVVMQASTEQEYRVHIWNHLEKEKD